MVCKYVGDLYVSAPKQVGGVVEMRLWCALKKYLSWS